MTVRPKLKNPEDELVMGHIILNDSKKVQGGSGRVPGGGRHFAVPRAASEFSLCAEFSGLRAAESGRHEQVKGPSSPSSLSLP